MKKVISLVAIALSLAACGGGGDGGSGPVSPPQPVKTALEGTWIAATDGRMTGSACGLSPSGAIGERETVTFTGNSYTYKAESCVILTGNTGGYISTDSANGTFAIGEITLQSADPSTQMTALDLMSKTTSYTSFNITANKLHIAGPFQTFDGKTREKRAFQIASYFDTVSRKLVNNVAFVKQ